MSMTAVSGDFNKEVERLVGADSKIAFAMAVVLEGVRNLFVPNGFNHSDARAETRKFVAWKLDRVN